MPPLIDATVSHYGESEPNRLADFVLDNARLIVLLAVLGVEIALVMAWGLA